MKRYVDFRLASWPDKTDGRMQNARWEACLMGRIGDAPPCAGVIDTLPIGSLAELIDEGWASVPGAPSDLLLRKAARRAVLETLIQDMDCLAPEEYTLVERMLIGDGHAYLETVPEFEAAYTLQMRLWCDVGFIDGMPAARLDAELMARLPDIMIREEHKEIRSRVFIFDGMMHGLLYLTGFLDDRLPTRRFIEEVLREKESQRTLRLARNFLEASFDCCPISGCNLLLHESLAAPETLVHMLAAQGVEGIPPVTPSQLVGSMNGLLPEESALDEKMRLALSGALRPEYDAQEAAMDLRMLVKQGAPTDILRDVMASMLCVMPTAHMENALLEMSQLTPRWIAPLSAPPPMRQAPTASIGLLH